MTAVIAGERNRAQRRAALGWRMQMVRAAVWEAAATGDTYTRLLLDAGDDRAETMRALVAAGPVTRSVSGCTVVTDPELGRSLLRRDVLAHRGADGALSPLQVMDLGVLGLGVDDPTGEPWQTLPDGAVDATVFAAVDAALKSYTGAVPGVGGAGTDLARVARAAAIALTAAVCGADSQLLGAVWPRLSPALDAQLSPQRLDDAWGLLRAGAELRLILREAGTDPMAQSRRVATVVVLAGILERAALGVLLAAADDGGAGWSAFRDGDSVAARGAARVLLCEDPPVRLYARVARTDLLLKGCAIAAGDQLVVLDPGGAQERLLEADPLLAAVAPLATGMAAALTRSVAARLGRPQVRQVVRARRSPVVGRWVSVVATHVERDRR